LAVDQSLAASVASLIASQGYLGIFLAMLIENFLQFIPSEAIMPLAGFLVYQGHLSLLPTIAAGTAGTIAGTVPWYVIGRTVNEERLENLVRRHGVLLGMTVGKLRKTRAWFHRYGVLIVFWGRLVPVVRTLVSIPAGIELMPWRAFLIWTSLGSLIWNTFLTLMGLYLGQNWGLLHAAMRPLTLLVLVALLGLLFWALIRRDKTDSTRS
jgi:membrane protein DedA with SNARE-associated domain